MRRLGRAGFAQARWLVLGTALALSVGGCMLQGAALDGPIAVDLRVVATSSTVEVDADGWFAATTAVYLCHADPPLLPEPGAARVGWDPGDACHGYGTFPSRQGLSVVLPIDDLADDDWPAFVAAEDWYLLLVEVDGDRAVSAIRSRFGAPRDVVAF